MLIQAGQIRERLAKEILSSGLHKKLETEKLIETLAVAVSSRAEIDVGTIESLVDDKDRHLLAEFLFEQPAEHTWEAAESCFMVLRKRQIDRELSELRELIESKPELDELKRLFARKQVLQNLLSNLSLTAHR
jgi:hypothetical protein